MKQAWVVILLMLIFSLTGCGRKSPGSVSPPSASVNFEIAEKHYQSGNYSEALQAYREYLKAADPVHRETALFHMALSYALAGTTSEDFGEAIRLFDTVALEYPQGDKAQQARLLSRSVRLIQELQAERAREEEALARMSQSLERLMERVADLERHREAEQSSPLRRATKLVQEGKTKEATQLYVSFLAGDPNVPGRDEAAFRLALIYLSENGETRDARMAVNLLEGILKDWPESIYASHARYLLSVHREVTRLRTQLDSQRVELNRVNQELQALKNIDLRRRQSETLRPDSR